ncbi:DEAD/DEAH box helicase [Roseomonas sp. NAR14]|uniref:DEAD/DEAH box helicase n=1 Tax=Roseomonas acroporae TaxID=2937791 RepID=A0A9X1Y8W8_9PROT|nr:DEAD/DEAH box helicase [Roseomonas acroporae]MCK8785230.1 DEAD/DEAH box helicase [Roseomonas acroporae]
MSVSLRDYQESVVWSARRAFLAAHRAVLVQLPTGAGKTRIFSHIAVEAVRRGNSVLILVHRKELLRQASEKLTEAGVPEHGIIAPGHTLTCHPVHVASVQTLGRRLQGEAAGLNPGLIIIDEAHHAVAGQWAEVIAAFPQARILGVTATPERADGKGLGRAAGGPFDILVQGPDVAWLTERGYLCPAVAYAPAHGPDLSGVGIRGGDYEAGALAEAMEEPSITGDAVAHYQRLAPGRPAVAFCSSIRHAEKVALAFRDAGWRAVAASGATPPADRDAAINGLADGSVQILCACELISEGLDVPAIGAVILLRPTKSVGLHLQQVGRGLRPAPGKDHLVILDHAGNTLRHGLPDTPREWSLAGRPKRQREGAPAVTQCPACWAMHPPAPKCPACGHSYGDAREERQELLELDGELVAVTPEIIARLRATPTRNLLRPGIGRAEVETIRRAKGFQPGWTWHVMREMGGAPQ